MSHTVVSGDTLWGIAQRNNLLVSEIAIANGGIQKLETLIPGMVIRFPRRKRSDGSSSGSSSVPVFPLVIGAVYRGEVL